jgi:hypothetical protein
MRRAVAYAVSDLSVKHVAAWATTLEAAEITRPVHFNTYGRQIVGSSGC